MTFGGGIAGTQSVSAWVRQVEAGLIRRRSPSYGGTGGRIRPEFRLCFFQALEDPRLSVFIRG
jgi:hypothetical protein